MSLHDPLYKPERYGKRPAYRNTPWAGALILLLMGACLGFMIGTLALAPIDKAAPFVCPEEMRCIPENEIRRFEDLK